MKLTEVFCEENIGMPVQYFWGIDHGKEVMLRGRFYGLGEDGESKPADQDGEKIFFVAPNNRYWCIPMGSMQYELTEEDKAKLKELEEAEEKPYGEYFDIDGDKYTKNFEYRKHPLTLTKFKREWYEDHKLYDVETDVLGRAIAKIFTSVYDKKYYYQKVMAHCEDTNPRAWQRANADRCMRVISPNIYGDKLYSSTTHYGVFNPPIWPSKDYTGDTLFKHVPVEVKEEDFLLYFSNRWNPGTIRIGNMENAAGDSWQCELYFNEYQFVPV